MYKVLGYILLIIGVLLCLLGEPIALIHAFLIAQNLLLGVEVVTGPVIVNLMWIVFHYFIEALLIGLFGGFLAWIGQIIVFNE